MSEHNDIIRVLADHLEVHMRDTKNLSDENARLRAQVRDLERKAMEARWADNKLELREDQEAPVLERDESGDPVEYDRWGTRRPVMNGKCVMTHAEAYEMMKTNWPSKPIKVDPAAAADTTPPTRRGRR